MDDLQTTVGGQKIMNGPQEFVVVNQAAENAQLTFNKNLRLQHVHRKFFILITA